MASYKGNKRTQRNIRTRNRLWPKIPEKRLWNWKEKEGFATIPRTIPYFSRIMDGLSKGKPVSSTYIALWCRLWDESGLIKIDNPAALANESGFFGQRALSTWRGRMKTLENLGFIKTKPLSDETYGYVLLLNPYFTVRILFDKKEYGDEGWYNALWERHNSIGATDLDDFDEIEN